MGFLDLEGVQKVYGPNTVVQNFNLSIARGEFVSFLGPSGCGKTTTLRMIAGFEVPSAGTIRIDGKDVTDLKPNQRNVGMVFQSYALFPNLTVAENIGFGLKVARQPKEAIFVAGGVAEVTPERCTVLAEEAIKIAEADRAMVEGRVQEAREALAACAEEEKEAALKRVHIAEALVAAVDRGLGGVPH